MIDDTIAAISTAVGEAGISIIRISGSDAIKIVSGIFKSKRNIDLKTVRSHTVHYGFICDSESNEVYDEVLVNVMKSPHTYTKEDIVEINCHGGYVPAKRILELVLKNGARLAEPGEFTKRAFINGRIDMSQAEAVIDIIRSKTALSNKYAVMQLSGSVKDKINEIKKDLVALIAHIFALMDFPDEDVEIFNDGELIDGIKNAIKKIDELLDSSEKGRIIREGLNTAIIGKPNVGKSSLLNALLNENRAIVTDIPGTTRDIIEEYLNIKGIPIKLIDTAGIRDTDELVEKIGVERSMEAINKADLIIFVFDNSRPLEKEDYEILSIIDDKNVLYVLNKIDLPSMIDLNEIRRISNEKYISLSSVTKEGFDVLENTVYSMVMENGLSNNEFLLTNMRHKDALLKAKENLMSCLNTIESGLTEDFVSIDLNAAIDNLGLITGETANEDLINEIFERFCVGK
ncbi:MULTISPECIES: tRNA uridine-5-carboxymethylaminomethyl(34) synthesis GTPase MnmE [Thermoanaerobacterium]|uniref:tRNA modification GTPase MnmE n=1 Tax=Thermoanaerobacterium butyriciformans TaxID=1702242 RepID=A0ABS4NG59_9THEO|nr:tRNA uridine-5-carboxymethylaminomethyl(34) synthesis GTPase MnmE [Thermoanaerobacterium butyriciformans]MBP2072109.1 tRNA modification GTPase [Thermoanaerobacterium butyriciformans]WHE07193.1 tRNA uridine-5-carboxymethylaminomethyl(34) synthesis GTPase MnmE [Thermoanaerobacterium thermosaccharolyticum]